MHVISISIIKTLLFTSQNRNFKCPTKEQLLPTINLMMKYSNRCIYNFYILTSMNHCFGLYIEFLLKLYIQNRLVFFPLHFILLIVHEVACQTHSLIHLFALSRTRSKQNNILVRLSIYYIYISPIRFFFFCDSHFPRTKIMFIRIFNI